MREVVKFETLVRLTPEQQAWFDALTPEELVWLEESIACELDRHWEEFWQL